MSGNCIVFQKWIAYNKKIRLCVYREIEMTRKRTRQRNVIILIIIISGLVIMYNTNYTIYTTSKVRTITSYLCGSHPLQVAFQKVVTQERVTAR